VGDLILVVDDNKDNRDLTQILLECEGFDVLMAEDATVALHLLATARPKMILMDVQLPGMDGLELTRRLRRDPSQDGVIIVALSAYAMAADKEKARAAGCDGYITKPVDTRTFCGTVRGYIEAASVHKHHHHTGAL
jgi:CheY-like chemotaxis protein